MSIVRKLIVSCKKIYLSSELSGSRFDVSYLSFVFLKLFSFCSLKVLPRFAYRDLYQYPHSNEGHQLMSSDYPILRLSLRHTDQQIGDHRCPDLDQHRVPVSAEIGLDLQILLNPLEELFDLPTLLVQVGDYFGIQVQMVGKKFQLLTRLRVDKTHQSQRDRTQISTASGQVTDPVATNARFAVALDAPDPFKTDLDLDSGDEKDTLSAELMEPGAVEIAFVE